MGFQTQLRAACVEMLGAYKTAVDIKLQIYPGRPRTVNPPTAFVDTMRETIVYVGHLAQRTPQADVVVVHGLYDSAEAASQKDDFVDGFLDWVTGDYHAAGANTLVAVVATEDDPTYVPDWLPPEQQRDYYATRITVEGFASD